MPDLLIAGDFFLDLAHVGTDDFGSLFDEQLVGFIKSHAHAIVNFEAALGEGCQAVAKSGPNLSSSSKAAEVALDIGFNIITLGNNHAMDFGIEGLRSTRDFFHHKGIPTIGAGECQRSASAPLQVQCGDRSVSIFNFCHNEWGVAGVGRPGVSGLDLSQNLVAVRKARSNGEVVVVITHMGHEYTRFQTPMVKSCLEAFAEAGAHYVINHHPHVVGGKLKHRDSYLVSSIGNFFFSPHIAAGSEETRTGLLVSLTLSEGGSLDVELVPVYWDPEVALLRLVSGNRHNEWMKTFEATSAIIADPIKIQVHLEELVNARSREYSARLEPRNNIVLRVLRKVGIFGSLWPKTRKYALLNVIRCETHREILIHMLEKELSETER